MTPRRDGADPHCVGGFPPCHSGCAPLPVQAEERRNLSDDRCRYVEVPVLLLCGEASAQVHVEYLYAPP